MTFHTNRGMSDLQWYPFKPLFDHGFSRHSYLYSGNLSAKKPRECTLAWSVYCILYSPYKYKTYVHCNLESPDTQFSDIQMRISTSSLSEKGFKRHRCESYMPLYKCKVTWNYPFSPFNLAYYRNCCFVYS